MLANISIGRVLKSSVAVFRESSALFSALPVKTWTCSSAARTTPKVICGSFATPPPVRHYARAPTKKKTGSESQFADLPPTLLKLNYAATPLAQTTDGIVKRLLSLELASHKEKLQLKTEQLIVKVQRDENDRSSEEVKIAILTAKIRNYQEHLLQHRKTYDATGHPVQIAPPTHINSEHAVKDRANKRRLLMAMDQRKKKLKNLRLVRYDAFEKVCEQLGITYTFPPEYCRRATRRWIAKKAFCVKVFKEVQKQKAEQRLTMKQSAAPTSTTGSDTRAAEAQ